MRRTLPALIVLLAVLAAAFAVNANAAGDNNCTMTNTNESITNTGGGFKPTVHFIVSCTGNQGWAITSWCSTTTDGGATWNQCANTSQITMYGNGDASWGIPVGNGSWGCVASHQYRGRSEFGNLSTASSGTTSLC